MNRQIFSSSPEIVESAEIKTRDPSLLITDMEGNSVLRTVYLIDFNTKISDDFQMTKNADYSFHFMSFGRAPVFMVVGGIQPFSVQNESGKSVKSNKDVELYYRQNSLSSGSPKLFTINTMTKQLGERAGQGIYKGYMHSFDKLPNEDSSIQGYQFRIGFICWG